MNSPFPKEAIFNDWGNPDKQTIFFLHANSYSAKLYQPFLEPLTQAFHILAPDLPGHGDSRWNGRIHAWSDLATYYIDQLEKNPPKKPMIGMGHSIGGIVMMLIAIERPDWFSRIILLDPVLLPKRIIVIMKMLKLFSLMHLIPLAKATKRRKRVFTSRAAALEHYAKKVVFSRWEPAFRQAYVDSCFHKNSEGRFQLSCAPELESSIYQSIPLNVWSIPKKLKVQALFIIGNFSDTVNQRGQSRLLKMRGNQLVKGIDGGHLFPFEKPEESMTLIKDFLK